MTRKEKKSIKKSYIILVCLTWLFGAVLFIVSVIVNLNLPPTGSNAHLLGMRLLSIFSPLLIGIIFGIIATNFEAKLKREKSRVLENKSKNYVNIFWNAIINNNIQLAKLICNNFLDDYYRILCNGILLSYSYFNGDDKSKEKAAAIINGITKLT